MVKRGLFYVFLCGLLVFVQQSRSARLEILRLPTIKIAFFLIMLQQFLLLLHLHERFLGRTLILLCQSFMVGIGRSSRRSLAGSGILCFQRSHLCTGSQ